MRSLVFSTLFAAALATFGSAAPTRGVDRIILPPPPSEGSNGFAFSTLFNQDLDDPIADSKNFGTFSIPSEGRARSPSTAYILDNLFYSTGPSVDQLGSLDPSNVFAVAKIVPTIEVDISQAISLLSGLVGMNRRDGISRNSPTSAQLAQQIAAFVNPVLMAEGHILDANVDPAVNHKVTPILVELGDAVDELVYTAESVVHGLDDATLAPLLAPVESVINALGLATLGRILGLPI